MSYYDRQIRLKSRIESIFRDSLCSTIARSKGGIEVCQCQQLSEDIGQGEAAGRKAAKERVPAELLPKQIK